MRNHTNPLKWQLSAAGNKAPTYTPGTAEGSAATFNLQGLPGRTEDMFAMGAAVCIEVSGDLDQESAGNSTVDMDQLYQMVSSIRLRSEVLGELFPAQHTRGAVVGNIIAPVGAGYRIPQTIRSQIPTTNQDNYFRVLYRLPLAQELFRKPHHHAIWLPLLEGGELEVRMGAASVLGGAGSLEVCTIRAWIEYFPIPEAVIPRPVSWREYITPGGSTQHILRNVGGQSGLRGLKSGARLAFLANLGDLAGLAGSDGPDNFTRLDYPWRGQVSLDAIQAEVYSMLVGIRHAVTPGGAGTSTTNQWAWPYRVGLAPDPSTADVPTNSANLLFLPMVFPGNDAELTKLQKVAGDLVCNYGYTATPSGSSRFVSCEVGDYTDDMKEEIMRLMGRDPNLHALAKKTLNKNNPAGVNASKLDALPDKILRVG
jgi:hypothetical protein